MWTSFFCIVQLQFDFGYHHDNFFAQTEPERIPNGPRTDPELTPHGPRMDLERTLNAPDRNCKTTENECD